VGVMNLSSVHEPAFGIAMYIPTCDNGLEEILKRLLVESGGSAVGRQMSYYDTMARDSDHTSRLQKIKPPTLDLLFQESIAGTYSCISVYDRKGEGSDDFVNLSVRIIQDSDTADMHRITVIGTRSMFSQEVLAYLRWALSCIEIGYGFIVVGAYECVLDVANTINVVFPMWYMDKPNPTYLIAQEISFYNGRDSLIGQFDRKIPRANWGNILSQAHVAGLGGEERIRAECGCFLVERWGENLYLQLTESPWDVTKEQLTALNDYFQPIRFPGAPDPVYF